jgi:hypothetical protein
MPPSSRPSRNGLVSTCLDIVASRCMLIFSAVSTPNLHNKEPAFDWHAPELQEFVPETFGGPMVRTLRSFSFSLICFSIFHSIPLYDLLNVSRVMQILPRHFQALIPTQQVRVLPQLRGRVTRHRPSIHMRKGQEVSTRPTIRTTTPSRHRQRTTYIGLLARSLRGCSHISARHMISLYQMPSAKSYRKRRRLHGRFSQTQHYHRSSSFIPYFA